MPFCQPHIIEHTWHSSTTTSIVADFGQVQPIKSLFFSELHTKYEVGIPYPSDRHTSAEIAKKNTYFFQYGGGLTLRIFLRSKWLLDLPDLEIEKYFGLFQ